MNTEDLRLRYKPEQVRILFVGESPAAGGDFFYRPGSQLLRYTQETFEQALGLEFLSGKEFLDCFAALGCYLEDLCGVPVNRMDPAKRCRYREKGKVSLASRMAHFQPSAIVGIMMAIQRHVRQAAHAAGLDHVPLYFLPFPSRGNQSRYLERLETVIRALKHAGMFARVPDVCKGKKRGNPHRVGTE